MPAGVLFVHNNFPAQFEDLARVLLARGTPCAAIAGGAAPGLPGATGASSGDQVLASFRPQHVQVVDSGGHTDPDLAWLAGTVKSSEFLGEMVRYRVSVGSHTIIADLAHEAGQPPITRESPVSLGVHPRHVRLLESNV